MPAGPHNRSGASPTAAVVFVERPAGTLEPYGCRPRAPTRHSISRRLVVELPSRLGLRATAGAGALRLGGRPAQRRGDLVGVDLGHRALLALGGLPGARLEPADDDDAVALGQGLGGVLGQLPPEVDPEEGRLPILPRVAVADAGGDRNANGGHGGAALGELQLGVVGQVVTDDGGGVSHRPLLGAPTVRPVGRGSRLARWVPAAIRVATWPAGCARLPAR